MIFIPTKTVLIAFNGITPSLITNGACEPILYKQHTVTSILQTPFFTPFARQHFDCLVLQHQTHSTDGLIINYPDVIKNMTLFSHDGDFLVTNVPRIALGILTADCVPLIFVDLVEKCVGIAHAGWKGSIAGIASKTVETLWQTYGSKPENIEVFIGPSANVCCYQVNQDFIEMVPESFLSCIKKIDETYFFDLIACNWIHLASAGIGIKNFYTKSALCTMHMPTENQSYCSHRRLQGNSLRNLSVVSLK